MGDASKGCACKYAVSVYGTGIVVTSPTKCRLQVTQVRQRQLTFLSWRHLWNVHGSPVWGQWPIYEIKKKNRIEIYYHTLNSATMLICNRCTENFNRLWKKGFYVFYMVLWHNFRYRNIFFYNVIWTYNKVNVDANTYLFYILNV